MVNPLRWLVLAPDWARSSSMVFTCFFDQPSPMARWVNLYCLSVDSRLNSTWAAVDWRT
jgi:hypothetical protein